MTICQSGWEKKKEEKFDEHEPFSREKLGTGTIYLNLSNIYLMSDASDVKYMIVWETKQSMSPWFQSVPSSKSFATQINSWIMKSRAYFEQEEATNNWRSCRNHEDPRLLPIALLCFLLCLVVSSSSVCCRQSWNRPLMSITWFHDGAQTWKNPLGRTWWIFFSGPLLPRCCGEGWHDNAHGTHTCEAKALGCEGFCDHSTKTTVQHHVKVTCN